MGSVGHREAGFERIRRTTKFMTAGALTGGLILSAAVAKTLPGRSGKPAPSSPPSTSQSPAVAPPAQNATNNPSVDQPLAPPVQAPQPSYSPPITSSGGS